MPQMMIFCSSEVHKYLKQLVIDKGRSMYNVTPAEKSLHLSARSCLMNATPAK